MRIFALMLSAILLNLVGALVIVPEYVSYSYLEYEELEIKLVKNSWNPIGIPYENPIINEGDCRGKYVSTIYYWNPSEGKYEYINSVREMKGGVGYWVYAKDDCTLRVSGSIPIGIDDITLSPGWNFIAGIRVNGRYVMRQDLEEKCYIEKGPYYYDPVEGKWEIFDELEEGKGFWIKCSPLQLDNCVFNEARLEITCDTNCRHVEGKPTIVTVTDKKKNMAVAIENDVKKGRIRISNGKLTFSTEPSLNMLDNDRSEWKIILVCNQPVGQAVESGVR